MTEVQHVVGSVVEGGAFCRGANSSCNRSNNRWILEFDRLAFSSGDAELDGALRR